MRKGVSFGHNHADSLSFELFMNRNTVFIDPGTYLYSIDDKWRRYFRKTMAHNTVSIDGKDLADVSNRFGIRNFPLSKIHSFLSNQDFDFIDMSHKGFIQLGIVHRRKILWFKKGYLILIDEIGGKGTHSIDSYFHIDSPNVMNQDGLVDFIDVQGEIFASIVPVLPKMLNLRFIKGSVDPILGWVSYRYGEKKPACVLKYSVIIDVPFVQCFLLLFGTKRPISVHDFQHRNNKYFINVVSSEFVDEICIEDNCENSVHCRTTQRMQNRKEVHCI